MSQINEEAIKQEVKKLLNTDYTNNEKKLYDTMEQIMNKHGQTVAKIIYDKFVERRKKLMKKADEIYERVTKKHPNMTQREIEKKVKEYQKRFNFDDDEYKIIVKSILRNNKYTLHSRDVREILPFTAISRALGYIPQGYQFSTTEMRVESNDMEALNQIIQLYNDSASLHRMMTIHTLTYNDIDHCRYENAIFPSTVDTSKHIDPVLVALFVPKFDVLDKKFLMTSLAGIIVKRKNGEVLKTQYEIEVFEDICRDPVETQCAVDDKPMHDILARCKLQVALQQCVLKLRQGKFYFDEVNNFSVACDMCKNTMYDAPDFMYVKDSGSTVRKIFGAMSFRPTRVVVKPIETHMFQQYLPTMDDPLESALAPFDSTVPIVFVRLPEYSSNETKVIEMNKVIKTKQSYQKHNKFVVREQEIVDSDGILVFYVSRRSAKHNFIRKTRTSGTLTLPMTTTMLERLNENEFQADFNLDLENSSFILTSMVVIETLDTSELLQDSNIDEKLIIGTCAIICGPSETENHLLYSPLDTGCDYEQPEYADKVTPIQIINSEFFEEYKSRRGTLYFYKQVAETSTKTLAGLLNLY